MASPHVAGVAALIRQVYPKLSPGAVAAKIRESATAMTCPADWPSNDPRQCTSEDGKTSFFGAGMVNAGAAVQ
jgi:subtilisin family serine protease